MTDKQKEAIKKLEDQPSDCVQGVDMKTEQCGCCSGTGICTDLDGNEGSCLTCGGRGYFTYCDSGKPF